MPQQVPLVAAGGGGAQSITTSLETKREHQQQQQKEEVKQQDDNSANLLGSANSNIDKSTGGEQTIISQVNGNIPSENSNNNDSNINSTGNLNKTTTTKLNGLKNRQRPPPLILDKVSNFYDNATTTQPLVATATGQTVSQQQQRQLNKTIVTSNSNPSINNEEINNTNSTSSANHKFWASLNQNASRSRGVVVPNNATDKNEANNPNKDLSNEFNTNTLGADLIITHRNSSSNSNGNTITSQPVATSGSHGSGSKQPAFQSRRHSMCTESVDKNETRGINIEHTQTLRAHDMSNTSSTHEDSSNHCGGASSCENYGGNLIGVDNPTPPASNVANEDGQQGIEVPPLSATSSRPRSNNPFLDDEQYDEHDSVANNSFLKRPASFIAATVEGTPINHRPLSDQNSLLENNLSSNNHQFHQQSTLQKQFGKLQLEESNRQQSLKQHIMHVQALDDKDYCNESRETMFVSQQQVSQNGMSQMNLNNSTNEPQMDPSSIYKIYGRQNGNYINYEPTISIDSESAVCKPPPSATMQLPHWTDAIYKLNNAILEASSITGGAENGQFIYLKESGDIILELDEIKVSGFTLDEFNELVESRSVHLLNAVQTKHSHGLTTDLKQYLSCSFPKNSPDKELQDLIRDNIYRRTIPCTTRPPKDDEIDKVDYHFLSKEKFIEMNNRGMLLECGEYGGHYYGTLRPHSDLDSLSVYASLNPGKFPDALQQPLNPNHPAIELGLRREAFKTNQQLGENPVYENHESLRMHQMQANINQSRGLPQQPHNISNGLVQHATGMALNQRPLPLLGNTNGLEALDENYPSNIVAVDSEALPLGWERVIDQTHGTYYIDHNTQRTQYERPYEIELTKGSLGFGFTLVEAENGVLLVRSVIPGGPAHQNGTIKTGDILLSAVGVPVAGKQHTDIARLFSTFAVGDRVRLTFARSTYVVDTNLVPDEYLFSNGTNGDLTVAVNTGYYNYFNQNTSTQSPHIIVDQEFEFLTVTLKRGDQGFGFTISDSVAGQKVRKIQNNETCTNLKQGDILMSLNGQDITMLTHREVVDKLKNCPPGQDVTLTVKRKKRFRSKTPMAMHIGQENYSLDSTPQRNCKTPSLDGIMLRRSANNQDHPSRSLFPAPRSSHISSSSAMESSYYHPVTSMDPVPELPNQTYSSLPIVRPELDSQSIYGGVNPMTTGELYYNQSATTAQCMSLPLIQGNRNIDYTDAPKITARPPSVSASERVSGFDNMTTNSINPSEISLPPMKFSNVNNLNQMNQYNNFMSNDKLIMMQMQQQQYQQMMQPTVQSINSSDYHQMPLYSNSDMLRAEAAQMLPLPMKPTALNQKFEPIYASNNYQNNFYANNDEIALQRVQYGCYINEPPLPVIHQPQQFMMSSSSDDHMFMQQQQQLPSYNSQNLNLYEEHDEHEIHQVDLIRSNTDANWGIRLIGGSEVNRAISIGSIVSGGAASKNGRLKPGDEIISINGINVVGATHQHVVEIISACPNRASLVIGRKKAEACDVVLSRNMDEGFGFVIISSGNCALIGRIIEGSPADRCQQLHVKDRIIAVNGREITPNMQHPEIVNMIKECGSTLRLRIIPADCYTVELIKNDQNDNFGFGIRGGSEYDGSPLYILRVSPNGLARDLLNVGDQIIEINGTPTVGMTHHQAASIIKHSHPNVILKLRRNFVTPPILLVDSPRALQKFNQVTAEMKTVNQTSGTPNNSNNNICNGNYNNQPNVVGSISSELGSSIQHHSSPFVDGQTGQPSNENSLVYETTQSMPLYAT